MFGSEFYGRNTKYKSKNGISVSTINDNLGVPISFAIASANTHDSKIILNQMDHMYIDTNTKRMRKNNRYKQYIYADSGYDTIKIKNKFKKKGYTPIIDPNIRSTIDEQKLQKYYKAKKLYKTIQHKRIVIENSPEVLGRIHFLSENEFTKDMHGFINILN